MEGRKDETVQGRPSPVIPRNKSQESVTKATKDHALTTGINKKESSLTIKGTANDENTAAIVDRFKNGTSDSAAFSPSSTLTDMTKSSEDKTTVTSAASRKSGSRTNSATDTENAGSNNIKVVVRVRPVNANELHRGDKPSIEYPSESVIWANFQGNTKPFTFNKVFQENSSQADIFEQCGIKDLMEKALDGFSCTTFAYGQTGSGKTYTITGPFNPDASEVLPSESLYGLLPRSFDYLLSEARQREEIYVIKAAYLEVYNEKVKDLLNPSNARDSLPVRWSSNRGFYVENIFMMECETLDDLMAVLEEGLRNRQVGAHSMNDYSSRSHTMLTVYLDSEMNDPEDDLPIIKQGKISFVDLAGNERVKETKATGEALTESQNINKSLLILGNCISALGDPKKRGGHIPYRESKLTKLLADSIGGEGFTLMIACISPSSSTMQDTLNTLRYANRAKNIKNKPVVKMDPREQLIISMKRDMKLLKAENGYLRHQLNIPCSDSQVVLTPEQIEGIMSAEGNSQSLSPAIGTATFSSLQSSSRNSFSEVKSEESVPRATTAMYAMSASIGLYDMLQEYIIENENLRQQNFDLFKARKEVEKDYEMMTMRNDNLTQKLENIERALTSTSLSLRSDDDDTITDSRGEKRLSLQELEGASPFHLSFPPIRTGTHPNMISADVDLAAEFEREHKKIKEERARKQREKQAEADERRTQEQGSERLLAKDANQSLNKSKADSSKTTGSAGIKRLDSIPAVAKELGNKNDQTVGKQRNAFKSKWKRKAVSDKEKPLNSYAAKFAVRKSFGPPSSQNQQQPLQQQSSFESETKHVNNDYRSLQPHEQAAYQNDANQNFIGNNTRPVLNGSQAINDQLRKELDQLDGQIQKEFAFKQIHNPTYSLTH